MPTLFKRLFGSNSRLHPCDIIVIRSDKTQQSHKVVLCNVGLRRPGIQRGRNEATQLTDFLSPGQTKFTTQQMSIVLFSVGFCLPGASICSRTNPNVYENKCAWLVAIYVIVSCGLMGNIDNGSFSAIGSGLKCISRESRVMQVLPWGCLISAPCWSWIVLSIIFLI